MTITEERIQAEIAAEVRRIEVWNRTDGHYRLGSLYTADIRSLANHLVRNRLQVEMATPTLVGSGGQAQDTGLLEAARELTAYVQQELIPDVRELVGGQELLDKGWTLIGKVHAAIAATKETA